jgi:hypothetical protein
VRCEIFRSGHGGRSRGGWIRRSRGALSGGGWRGGLASQNFEHDSSAGWTLALDGLATILHGFLDGIHDFLPGLAFDAISFCHKIKLSFHTGWVGSKGWDTVGAGTPHRQIETGRPRSPDAPL